MSWLVPKHLLTSAQMEAVDLSPAVHRAIKGGNLTGKTQVLLHRAKHLQDSMGLGADGIRLWTGSESASSQLRSGARVLDIDPSCIESYDGWCRKTYQTAIADVLPINGIDGEIDNKLIRMLVRYAVNWGIAQNPSLGALLLDDAQDFSSEDVAFMVDMASHVTISARSTTTRLGEPIDGLLGVMGLDKWNIDLRYSYQRNPSIMGFLHAMQRDGPAGDARLKTSGSETPYFFAADDEEQEMDRLAEVIKDRIMQNELSLGVLVANRRGVVNVARALEKRGLAPDVDGNFDLPAWAFSPASIHPKILPLDCLGGLTFDTIFIPGLSVSAYRGYLEEEVLALVILAASHAKRWLYLSSKNPSVIRQLDCQNRSGGSLLPGVNDDRSEAIGSSPLDRGKVMLIDDLL